MKQFLKRHADQVAGTPTGLDQVLFRYLSFEPACVGKRLWRHCADCLYNVKR